MKNNYFIAEKRKKSVLKSDGFCKKIHNATTTKYFFACGAITLYFSTRIYDKILIYTEV